MSSLLPSTAALPGRASPAEQAIVPGSSLSSLLFSQLGLSLFFFSLCPFPRISFQPVQWVGGIVACYCNSFYRSFMFFGLRFTSSVNSSEGSSSFRSSGSSVQVVCSGQRVFILCLFYVCFFYPVHLQMAEVQDPIAGSQIQSESLCKRCLIVFWEVFSVLLYSWKSGGSAHGSLR